MKPIVSIARYKDINSVAEAIQLCDGFKDLKPTHTVLLKPNVVTAGAGFIPPYGTVTTTAVIEGTIKALKDFGVTDISVGEGTVLDELGTNTTKAFKWIKADKLAQRYGVKLLDFNAGPHTKLTSEDVPIQLATAVLETDFFINLPVLKTHSDTRVSLAGKNLKGCMSMASKKYFHGPEGILHYRISRLMEAVNQHLVILDGIYTMDKGPDATTGTAHRRDVLVASTDFLAADAVGTILLGIDPKDSPPQAIYAERHNRMDILEDTRNAVEIRGEAADDFIAPLPWTTGPGEDMRTSGHKGFEIKVHTYTMCSGCYGNLTGPSLLLASLSRNKNFGGLKIIAGKSLKEEQNSPKTILYGNCAIKENPHLDRATKIEGCPPKFFNSLLLMANQMEGFLSRVAFFTRLGVYFLRASLGIGMLPLPRFAVYTKNPDFQIKHFRPA